MSEANPLPFAPLPYALLKDARLSANAKVVAGLILWGGLIELMQLAAGWRYGEWIDWLADAIGVLTVWLPWRLLPGRLTGRVLPART